MADSSKDLQLRELKDMVTDLKKMIKTLQATVDAANKREEALMQERDNLKDEINLLRKKLFGTSSEKHPVDFPGQLNLFNEAEMEQDPAAAEAKELAATFPAEESKKRRNRATDAGRFKGIPVTKKYLDLPDEDKLCPACNTPLVKIGEEFVRRELVFIPAKLKIVEIYSLNYSYPECSKRNLPIIKKERMENHICFMAWRLPVRLHGSCTRSFVTVFHTAVRKKTGNSMVLQSHARLWLTG